MGPYASKSAAQAEAKALKNPGVEVLVVPGAPPFYRKTRNAGKYDWQLNVSTGDYGDYTAPVDSKVQLIRMAGGKPPYLYWARELGGSPDALHGPVETTPKKAIASLRTMMKLRDSGRLGSPRRGTAKDPAAYLWDGVAYDVYTMEAFPASWSGYAFSDDGKAVIRVGRSGGERSFDVARLVKNPKRNRKYATYSGNKRWSLRKRYPHQWSAENSYTGAVVLGSPAEFRSVAWAKRHGVPKYIVAQAKAR